MNVNLIPSPEGTTEHQQVQVSLASFGRHHLKTCEAVVVPALLEPVGSGRPGGHWAGGKERGWAPPKGGRRTEEWDAHQNRGTSDIFVPVICCFLLD